MFLDRDLQLDVLVYLLEIYPASVPKEKFKEVGDMFPDEKTMLAHLSYLDEQGLIISGYRIFPDGSCVRQREFRLTAAGHDYLAEDGGIDAIKRTIIVKFDNEFKTQLNTLITNSQKISSEDKKKLVDVIRELPVEGTRRASMRLLDEALNQVPNLARLLKNIFF